MPTSSSDEPVETPPRSCKSRAAEVGAAPQLLPDVLAPRLGLVGDERPQKRDATGRDPDAFGIGKRVYIAVEGTQRRARERLTPVLDGMYDAPGLTERVAVCGPPEACAEQLRELVAAGARELLLHPMYDHLDQLEALASVAALVRDG